MNWLIYQGLSRAYAIEQSNAVLTTMRVFVVIREAADSNAGRLSGVADQLIEPAVSAQAGPRPGG